MVGAASACIGACSAKSAPATDKAPKPDRHTDPRVLDGMERNSANRIAVESALEAIAKRDLAGLRMLRLWVQKRALEPLWAPEDLRTLDQAIACLEGGERWQENARATLDGMKTKKLQRATRRLCLGEE